MPAAASGGLAESLPRVEYLVVAANEGRSAGGHAALRIDRQVFHFQRAPSGLLLLARADADRFDFLYRLAGNRSMEATELALGDAQVEELRHAFALRLHRQRGWLRARRALDDEVALLTALAASGGEGPVSLVLAGAGFFDLAVPAASSALETLRERIRDAHAAGVLARRRSRLLAQVDELEPELAATVPPSRSSAQRRPFAQQHRDLTSALLALEVLERAPALRDAALVRASDSIPRLDDRERAAARRRSRALGDELASLFDSQRPDWGFAFLLGMARLAALERSLDADRWIVLDALADSPRSLSPDQLAPWLAALEPLHRHRRHELASLRTRLRDGTPWHEVDHSALEAELGSSVELGRALAGGARLRLRGDNRLPRGLAPWRAPVPTKSDATTWPGARAAALERREAHSEALLRSQGYELLSNNCATALLAQMDGALWQGESLARRAPLLDLIPATSDRIVRARHTGARQRHLLSQRLTRLGELRETENDLLVAVRESNRLTSTLYPGSPSDTPFLFFTDDRVWARPLLGLANLATGLAHSGAGLLRAPFDRGASLHQGLRGSLMSLPELVFVSIRKGSYPFSVPQTEPVVQTEPVAQTEPVVQTERATQIQSVAQLESGA